MSDGVLTQLIISLTSIVISLITAWVSVKVSKKLDKADTQIKDVAAEVKQVSKQTNGMTERLVHEASKNAYEQGLAHGLKGTADKDSSLDTLN